MNPTVILIFILLVSILYVVVKRYKQEERERLEKSKKIVTNLMKIIPKKMKKIMKKADETFPSGAVQLAATIACGDNTKLIEAFEDIKDIRYGKLGASNSVDGATTNKWIKISSFTVSGAWDPRGFTLEVYPRIRTISSSRQTLVCLVRNADKDIEAPYVSLTTHNEAEPNSRFIKDVRVVRTGGSGITSNTVEVWIQMSHPWANTGYVMYYLYNFNTKDFIATVPQAQVDNPPAGQAWGISENIEPQNGKYPIKGSKIKVGDKWTLSGVGDAHGNDDWLRLFGADEKGYYGGLAANKLYTPELHIPGNVYSTMNVTGGNIGHESGGHEFRHANRTQGIGLGYNTIYATGSNTDQDLGLKARGAGKVRVTGDAVVNGKLSLNRNALNFSNAEWDKNHNIYNNVWNLDKEGAWDGMKINSYAGLRVRVGDSNGSTPKTALEVTDSNTKVKDVFCINNTCMSEADLKRYKNIMPQGYINIVNRRPLFGVGVKTKPGVFWGNNAQPLVDHITYGPFGYNVPPVAAGAVRKFRMYGVYTDGMTGGAGPVVRVSILNGNWVEYGKFVDFQFPLTWGGLEETRDAFSNVVNDPADGMHGILYTFVPAGSTGNNAVRWQYVELQTLDIY